MLENSENCLLIFLGLSAALLKKQCLNMVWKFFSLKFTCEILKVKSFFVATRLPFVIIWLKVKCWKSLLSFLASIAKMTQFLQWQVWHSFILVADSLMIDNSFLLAGKGTLSFWKQAIVGSWIIHENRFKWLCQC